MKAEIYPDLSGRGDINQRRVQPYVGSITMKGKPRFIEIYPDLIGTCRDGAT